MPSIVPRPVTLIDVLFPVTVHRHFAKSSFNLMRQVLQMVNTENFLHGGFLERDIDTD